MRSLAFCAIAVAGCWMLAGSRAEARACHFHAFFTHHGQFECSGEFALPAHPTPESSILVFYGNEDQKEPVHAAVTVCLGAANASAVEVFDSDLNGHSKGEGKSFTVAAGDCVTRSASYSEGEGITVKNEQEKGKLPEKEAKGTYSVLFQP